VSLLERTGLIGVLSTC